MNQKNKKLKLLLFERNYVLKRLNLCLIDSLAEKTIERKIPYNTSRYILLTEWKNSLSHEILEHLQRRVLWTK